MTREEVERHIKEAAEAKQIELYYAYRDALLAHDQAQRAVIAKLQEDLEIAERALRSKGYRKECDIPACNCGPQWNHGGHADQRLREISDALPYVNGATILQRVKQQAKEIETMREALRTIIECEDQWTRHDMVREAKYALKEVTT